MHVNGILISKNIGFLHPSPYIYCSKIIFKEREDGISVDARVGSFMRGVVN
jgi:hypothetical protein